jgi:ketol-acid reductoisomerase
MAQSQQSSHHQSVRCFTQKDATPDALKGERVAILGYGHLGQPFALNLRDSGASDIVIGNIPDEYARLAEAQGFRTASIEEAVHNADLALVMLPDDVIPEVFQGQIAPNLAPGSAVVFGSGYTLGYGLIEPPPGVDVLLLAPRMAGENARMRFQEGRGFYAYVSVEQEASGKAWQRLLGLAAGVGVLQAGALELTARQEADLDLVVEQTLGAVLGVAIMNIFAMGVDAGLPPEAMVMELYMSEEMETVWRSFREQGFLRAANAHGPTALYGGFIRTMQFIGSDLPERFRQVFEEIRSGEFARGFQAERQAGYPMLSQAMAMSLGDHPISEAEGSLRRLLGKEA